MKLKFNKLQTIIIIIISFIIIFPCNFVNASDTENENTGSNNYADNKTYTVTNKDVTFSPRNTSYDVHATIFVPNNTTDDRPLVVMCHGFGGNRQGDGKHFFQLGSILAENGIAAITIDMPGCGESSAPQTDYTLTNMYDYVNSAITYMTSNYDIDTNRLGITGHSMGGRLASMYTQVGDYSIEAVALWAPANGDGSDGYSFLHANGASFNFNLSNDFYTQMDASYPNQALSSYGGRIFLAYDSTDQDGQGLISSNIVTNTMNTVTSKGGQVETYNSDHNFIEGNGGQVVNDTANFFGIEFLGREITSNTANNDEPLYTIEDIIFNRIPILDINFFSDTAGGQPVNQGSAVDIIRTAVATWYVSFRNIVVIALAIIIIYIGIRMALSTIPSDEAKYKTMLVGWIQALVIVFVIHWIMILTINTNNGFVSILEKTSQNIMASSGYEEDSIYETIRTRAYDFRFSVSLPATIMYIVLFIIWLKFLWVYIKRSFTILILVVIAPFIGAKYAIDCTRGKKGSSFSSWLYDFILNVLLQTVHAIIYTVLMTSALKFAFTSIIGFIIALILMNFMLDADEIFRDIFNFSGRSSLAKEAANAREERKQILSTFAGAMFVGQVASTSINIAKGAVATVTKTGKRIGKKIDKNIPQIGEMKNNALNWIDTRVENFANNQIEIGGQTPGLVALQKQAKIRKLSREKGIVGVKARKLKNSISSNRKKRYKANFKLIKNATVGSLSTILAIPMTVVEPTLGIGMATAGYNFLKSDELHKKHYVTGKDGSVETQNDIEYKTKKYTKKRDKNYKAVDLLENISKKENNIRGQIEELKKNTDENDFNRYKDSASQILVAGNKKKIENTIKDYLEENKIKAIDNNSINGIINEITDELKSSIKMDSHTQNMMESNLRSQMLLLKNKMKAQYRMKSEFVNTPDNELENKIKYTNNDIVSVIQNTVTDSTVDKKYRDVTKELFKLDNSIGDFESKAKTSYRGANKFLQGL